MLCAKLKLKYLIFNYGSHYEAAIRKPLVTGGKSYHDVTVDIMPKVKLTLGGGLFFLLPFIGFFRIGYVICTISTGIGV